MSQRAKLGGVLALVSAAVAVACSSFSTVPQDDATDAGPSATDAGPGATDADVADASPDPCTGSFCTGFDEVSPLDGWLDVSRNGGVAVVDTTGSTSPPSALHVKTGTGATAPFDPASAAIRRIVPRDAPWSTVCFFSSCRHARRVGQVRAGPEPRHHRSRRHVPPARGQRLRQRRDRARCAVDDGTGAALPFTGEQDRVERLEACRIGRDFGGLAPSATLSLDGATLAAPGFSSPIPSGAVSAVLGVNYVERGDEAWQLHFDDVDCATRD